MKRGTRVRSILAAVICISLILTILCSMSATAASREELMQAVEEAELLDEFYYQPASFKKLEEAKEAAKPFMDEGYGTQEELDKAYFALMDAIVGLKSKVDKNALDSCIITVGFLDENRFQPDGWNAMVETFGKAKAIAYSEESTQSQVDLAFQNLILSISRLVQKDGTVYEPDLDDDSVADKTVLNAMLYNASLLDPKAFTEFSWEIFSGTLVLAQEIADDTRAKKADVVDIQKELILAQADLERDYNYGIHKEENAEFPLKMVQTAPDTKPSIPVAPENPSEPTENTSSATESTTSEEPMEEPSNSTVESSSASTPVTSDEDTLSPKPSETNGGFPVLPVVLAVVGVVVVAAVVLVIIKIKGKNA